MKSLKPIRAMAHPLWWGALALLVINDHIFKGAGVLPQPLVGKISDFAGLMVAPVVLAALLQVTSRRGFALAHVAIGLGFAAINLSPTFAAGFEAVMALTPFPWSIYVDPSDALALPMLLASWLAFTEWTERPAPVSTALSRAGLALGALACVATSPPPEPPPVGPDPPTQGRPRFQPVQAAFVVLNDTGAEQLIRIRELRMEVELDCAALRELEELRPDEILRESQFLPATSWIVEPGRAAAISGADECGAALIEGPDFNGRMLFWEDDQRPTQLPSSIDDAELSRSVILRGDTLRAPESAALFALPTQALILATEACATPAVGSTLDWTQPDYAVGGVVQTVRLGADGCHQLRFADLSEAFFLCAPGVELPFAPGDQVSIDAGEDRLRIQSDTASLDARRGDEIAGGFGWTGLPKAGCEGHHDTCDAFVRPLSVVVGETALRPGDSLQRGDHTLHVLRAQLALVRDVDCGLGGQLGRPNFESVMITTTDSEEQ